MGKISESQQKRMDRRKFLRQFAMISTLSLTGPLSCYCTTVYGPGPSDKTFIEKMTYRLKDGGEKNLYDGEDIPSRAEFVIKFYYAMSKESQNAVSLKDEASRLVPITFQWSEDGTFLLVKPKTKLKKGNTYILAVTEDAWSQEGYPLWLTSRSQAKFKISEL